MKLDRFKNFEQDVRELVLAFEKQKGGFAHFFDVDDLMVIADYYLEVYDIDGLEAVVKYGEQLYPDSSEIRLRRSHLLSVQGLYPQSLAILKDLEKAEPENTDVHYALGALYGMTDHPEQAVSYYLKAATDGYQLDMIYGNIGDEYYRMGKSEEAIRYYKMSVERNPDEERSMHNLACTFDEQGLDAEAVEFFSKMVEEHPYSKSCWACLGRVYGWLRQFDKSVDAYEYAIAIDKTMVNAYIGLSEGYHMLGDIPHAVQALRDSLEFADDRPYILHSIGRLFLESGNYHTASTYLHDALKEDPAYSLAWNDLGRCCECLGYSDEAAGYYRRAIDLDPDSDEHWMCLADLYIRTERYLEACALLESARTDAVERFVFDTRLVYCYFKLGRRNRLFALLNQEAPEFGPLYPSILSIYPEMSEDAEIVNCINSLSAI